MRWRMSRPHGGWRGVGVTRGERLGKSRRRITAAANEGFVQKSSEKAASHRPGCHGDDAGQGGLSWLVVVSGQHRRAGIVCSLLSVSSDSLDRPPGPRDAHLAHLPAPLNIPHRPRRCDIPLVPLHRPCQMLL